MHIDLTTLPSMDLLDVRGKTIFVRIDVNGSDHRIARCIPTIKELRRKGARIVLLAHFGRPLKLEEAERHTLTLKPIAKLLEKQLKAKVKYISCSCGPQLVEAIDHMKLKDVILLENVRFDPREKTEMSSLVRQWGRAR